MALGVGGSNFEKELNLLKLIDEKCQKISISEYEQRIKKAQSLMKRYSIVALYLNAGANLQYFTGTKWYTSERMVGAILPANGSIAYIAPNFELGTLDDFKIIKGNNHGWQEHENPYELFGKVLSLLGIKEGKIALDESSAFFLTDGINQINPQYQYISAQVVTAGCRMIKSANEIALMQRVKDITMVVHQSVAKILYEGITTKQVEDFIHKAHIKMGAKMGSYFCIVLFGKDSAFPHGVKQPKALELNDMVLIDTGCQIDGYISDITRSYVFGEANERQRQVWIVEKNSQASGFAAAEIGKTCASVDKAARDYLVSQGFGPEYDLPGLPHRTGHGIGLDIHEWPYLVAGNTTVLEAGMCFSNEPMLCIPGEFGIRLEDHFYMTESGPKWFTQPSHSIDDPFGYSIITEE